MAEHDLATLLKTLTVRRHQGVWSYETVDHQPDLNAVPFAFREAQAWTQVVPALAGDPANRWVWLELAVYSDLNAVGFLAAVAAALSEAGVPCNAVAAFHHDHIFVPEELADRAIKAIEALAAKS